jgi:hypothetical protein
MNSRCKWFLGLCLLLATGGVVFLLVPLFFPAKTSEYLSIPVRQRHDVKQIRAAFVMTYEANKDAVIPAIDLGDPKSWPKDGMWDKLLEQMAFESWKYYVPATAADHKISSLPPDAPLLMLRSKDKSKQDTILLRAGEIPGASHSN